MSLEDTIKGLKDQIADEDKKDDAVTEEALEEKEEEDKPEEKAEEKTEETKEESKAEEKPVEEDKPDALAFQKLRRETAALKKKAEESETRRLEAEARLVELQKPIEETKEESRAELPDEIVDMVQDHRRSRAEREFQSLEAKFRKSTPEYDDVAAEYTLALAHSIRIQNPRLTNNEIAEKTKETILLKAATHQRGGFDPVEEMYHEAKDLGFTGKSLKKQEETKEEEEIKPDLKKVAVNRAKSTGMAATSGKSTTGISRQYIEQNGMPTVAEWSKLSPTEKQRLFYG